MSNAWIRLLITLSAGTTYIVVVFAIHWLFNVARGAPVGGGFASGSPIGTIMLAMLLIGTPIVAVVVTGLFAPAAPSRAHLCHKCGYDLTGNVSGVCPECGRKLTRSAPPASAPHID